MTGTASAASAPGERTRCIAESGDMAMNASAPTMVDRHARENRPALSTSAPATRCGRYGVSTIVFVRVCVASDEKSRRLFAMQTQCSADAMQCNAMLD